MEDYNDDLEVNPKYEKLRYRFEVHYQSKEIYNVSKFMRNLDLGNMEFALKEVFTFTYDRPEKPVQYFKDLFYKAFESLEARIIKIEGGKIE